MNNFRKILVGGVAATLLAGFGTSALAQADTATATTSVTVIRAIAIEKDEDMSFGTIVRPATTQTVTLGTNGTISSNVVTVGSAAQAAQFTVTGEGGQTFSISETPTLSGPGGSLALTLTKAVSGGGAISTTGSNGTGTLSGALGDSGDGQAILTYGASFSLSSTLATGEYSGSLIVEVNYN